MIARALRERERELSYFLARANANLGMSRASSLSSVFSSSSSFIFLLLLLLLLFPLFLFPFAYTSRGFPRSFKRAPRLTISQPYRKTPVSSRRNNAHLLVDLTTEGGRGKKNNKQRKEIVEGSWRRAGRESFFYANYFRPPILYNCK
jgi:hypothetical protein